jgi:hypothetical protein
MEPRKILTQCLSFRVIELMNLQYNLKLFTCRDVYDFLSEQKDQEVAGMADHFLLEQVDFVCVLITNYSPYVSYLIQKIW